MSETTHNFSSNIKRGEVTEEIIILLCSRCEWQYKCNEVAGCDFLADIVELIERGP
jgi:hypothetical protein